MNTPETKYYIGIDGGGTKTKFLAGRVTENLEVIGEYTVPDGTPYEYEGAQHDGVHEYNRFLEFYIYNVYKRKDGDLRITKCLPTYEMSEPATFVFDVVAKDDDKNVVYSNVAVLTLTTENTKSTILHHIPAGSHVTVTERYTGNHYTLDCAANQTTDIVAGHTVTVNFTNEYSEEDRGGHGLANVFRPTNNGWEFFDRPEDEATSTPNNQTLPDYVPEPQGD